MKFASQDSGKSRSSRHPEPIILFAVANQMFAIAADAVQEIRSTDSLAGAAIALDQQELSKVRHMVERGHHTYFIVNAGRHFGLPVSRPTLVLIMRQLRVAVLVDRIERMEEIWTVHPLPRAFTGEERRWYRGLTYLDDHVIPVISPFGFLTKDEFQRLDRAAMAVTSQRDMEGAVKA
jgi:chemotaxis signal transduction protein